MKTKWLAGFGAGVVLAAALLLGRGMAAPPERETTTGAVPASFGVTLGTDQAVYAVPAGGTPPVIHATLTLFNRSETPLTVHEHGQQYEWQILDAGGQVVWDYAEGRRFPMFIRLRTLGPGQLNYSCDIPLQTQDGTALAPGRYTLRGTVIADGATASLPFTVTGGTAAPN